MVNSVAARNPRRRSRARRHFLSALILTTWEQWMFPESGWCLPAAVRAGELNHVLGHRGGRLGIGRHLIMSELVERFPRQQQIPGALDRVGTLEQRADVATLASAGGGLRGTLEVDDETHPAGLVELARLGSPPRAGHDHGRLPGLGVLHGVALHRAKPGLAQHAE